MSSVLLALKLVLYFIEHVHVTVYLKVRLKHIYAICILDCHVGERKPSRVVFKTLYPTDNDEVEKFSKS